MSLLEEKWNTLHQRLIDLDYIDEQEEAHLLRDAYDNLVLAYQKSRELNDEMKDKHLKRTQNKASSLSAVFQYQKNGVIYMTTTNSESLINEIVRGMYGSMSCRCWSKTLFLYTAIRSLCKDSSFR